MSSGPGNSVLADTFLKDVVANLKAHRNDTKAMLAQLKAFFHQRAVLVPETTKPGEPLATQSSADVRSLHTNFCP